MSDHANPDEHIDIDLWYTSSDHRSLRLIFHLGKYVEEVKDIMRINPKIVSKQCGPECSEKDKKDHCLSNGKYCDMHSDLQLNGKLGADHMLENLFQYCIAKESQMSGRP